VKNHYHKRETVTNINTHITHKTPTYGLY